MTTGNGNGNDQVDPKTWSEYKREAIGHDLFITGTELYGADLQPPGFLVRQLIPDVGIGLFVGAPGSCKSWIAYELARAAATGTPWMGRSAPAADGQKVNVAIANYDMDSAELRRRCIQLGIPGDRLYLHTLGISSSGTPGHILRMPDDEKALIELMQHFHIKLLVVDSMRHFHMGDENDSKEIGAVTASLRAISANTRSFVALIHHTNKMGGSRGSGEISAALDVELFISSKEIRGGAGGNVRWGKTRGWSLNSTKRSFGFTLLDEKDEAGKVKTVGLFNEHVPGLDEVEDHLQIVLKALRTMGGAAEPEELIEKVGEKINRLELAAAIRFGKQVGKIVKAKLPGKFQNDRRVGINNNNGGGENG